MLWKELFGVTKSLISPRRLCCRREQDKAQAVTENEELRKKNKQLMQECEEVSENRLQLVGMLTPPFRFRPSNHRGRSGGGGGFWLLKNFDLWRGGEGVVTVLQHFLPPDAYFSALTSI